MRPIIIAAIAAPPNGSSGGGGVTLGALALSAAIFVAGDAAGTDIGTVLGSTAGSSLALLAPTDATLALAAGVLKVGAAASAAGTINLTIRETAADGVTTRDNALLVTVDQTYAAEDYFAGDYAV
ncbi:MAG: hypothetical protein ACOYOH_27085 [Paracraurococcus sp.]